MDQHSVKPISTRLLFHQGVSLQTTGLCLFKRTFAAAKKSRFRANVSPQRLLFQQRKSHRHTTKWRYSK